MIHPLLVGWMILLTLTLDLQFVAAHNCGSGVGQFEKVYSSDFDTAEDCEKQCGYVTGEAESICKAAEGGACIGESWVSWLTGAGFCQAASGACATQEAIYINQQRDCEVYCGKKYPAEYEIIKKNIDETRDVLIGNLKKLGESIAMDKQLSLEILEEMQNSFQKRTRENQKNKDEILRHLWDSYNASSTLSLEILEEIQNSFQRRTTENEKNKDEILRHLKDSYNASFTLLTSIDDSLDTLSKDLQYNTHVSLFGDVFEILDNMETRYSKVQHDPETGLIVRDFESDQYSAAVTDPNLGMVIGIEDIMSMLVTGNGKNWAKSKSIYEETPQEFCKQKWFTVFSLKLTRSLFHYRNGRRMHGNPLPPWHSEKKYHDEHYEHYSSVCECNKEDIPIVNNKTPICGTSVTIGDVCQVECLGHHRDVVLCEKGPVWTVNQTWIERDDEEKWTCKALDQYLYLSDSKIVRLPSFEYVTCNQKFPEKPLDMASAGVVTVNGKKELQVCGGTGRGMTTCQLWTEDGWVETATGFNRMYAGASTVGGSMIVTGGRHPSTYKTLSSSKIYTEEDGWLEFTSLPVTTEQHCQVTVGDSVYIVGGNTDTDWGTTGDTYRLSLSSNQWVKKSGLNTPRRDHGCAEWDDGVLVVGGYGSGWIALSSVEKYNPVSNKWFTFTPLPTTLYGMQVLVWDNDLYVFGGFNDDGNDDVDNNKIYKLKKGEETWETLGVTLENPDDRFKRQIFFAIETSRPVFPAVTLSTIHC